MDISSLILGSKKAKLAASGKKGGKPAVTTQWPSGIKIGIVGHGYTGKTVLYTVLYEESRFAGELQLSVSDTATSNELVKNTRAITGRAVSEGPGTRFERMGDKSFPDATMHDLILRFTAILNGSAKVPVVCYDFPGEILSLGGNPEQREKAIDFFCNCDALIFVFDPKLRFDELGCRSRVETFVTILERIAPHQGRIPIPIALMVTKSDTLAGFGDEAQITLLTPENEHAISEDFDTFVAKVMTEPALTRNQTWAGEVRDILVKSRELLRVVLGRTLDFQIFFVSATGQPPIKIGSDVGHSKYRPPDKLTPIGVKAPFYWILQAIARNKSISRFRTVAKWTSIVAAIWIIVYSIPFMFHFWYQLPFTTRVEDTAREHYPSANYFTMPKEPRNQIRNAYERYSKSFVVKQFFPGYALVAQDIYRKYTSASVDDLERELKVSLDKFTGIVRDTALWPSRKVDGGDSLFVDDLDASEFVKVGDNFQSIASAAPENSTLKTDADRAVWMWQKFRSMIFAPDDPELLKQMRDRVAQDKAQMGPALVEAFSGLGQVVQAKTVVQQTRKEAGQLGSEIGGLFDRINASTDLMYRVKGAVRELKEARQTLSVDPANNANAISKIDRYVQGIEAFSKRGDYAYRATNIPAGHHLHIMVKEPGRPDAWVRGQTVTSTFPKPYVLKWKAGDEIHIALDPDNHDGKDEYWGERSEVKRILNSDFALFEMEGTLTIGSQSVTIVFDKKLIDILPVIQ